jgi:hypothetical protein
MKMAEYKEPEVDPEVCEHSWVANSGTGGEPNFKMNRNMHPFEPLMHVRCPKCHSRTWFTPTQWNEMPVGNE